jgi:multiple sugar transport system substrate-binding protein/raffinose/stachyose/melibiose transport system substrate-binding protein
MAGLAAAVCLSVFLAACGGNSGGNQPTQLTGTVRMLVNITPVLTKAYYQGLVAPYVQAHPGVTVNIEAPTGQDVAETLQQEIAAGNPADIISGGLPTTVAKLMVDLPNESWVTDTPLAASYKVGGKFWTVGSGMQPQSLVFYNKAAFAKAGITTLPTSVDQFTADMTQLKAAGYVPLQTAGEWVTGYQFTMLANPSVLSSDPDWYAKRNKGSVSFASSAYSQYLNDYQGWIQSGLVPKNAPAIKYQDSIDEFNAGKSAMFVMGSWLAASVDGAKKSFDVGVFPVPTLSGAPGPVAGSVSMPYSITKASQHQALDLDLVKYLVSDKAAVTSELQVEGNFRAGFSYQMSPLNQAVGQILDQNNGQLVVVGDGSGDDSAPAGFGTELGKDIQSMYLGTSASSVLGSIDTWWTSNVK